MWGHQDMRKAGEIRTRVVYKALKLFVLPSFLVDQRNQSFAQSIATLI